jgi:hypothetical protein
MLYAFGVPDEPGLPDKANNEAVSALEIMPH